MKAKKLFIFGLAAVALSSCGGPKKYSKEANKETFFETIKAALTASGMMGSESEAFYSFVYESSSESESSTKLLKDGKGIADGSDSTKSNSTAKYDAKNALFSSESSSESTVKNPVRKSDTTTKSEYFYQTDSANFYSIDKLTKGYEKTANEKPAELVEARAMSVTSDLEMILKGIPTLLAEKDSKAYIDDNVYTIVLDVNETTTGAQVKSHALYQMTITNNKSLEFYEEHNSEEKSLNTEEKSSSKRTIKLEKKDVSLKALDLNDYLLESKK